MQIQTCKAYKVDGVSHFCFFKYISMQPTQGQRENSIQDFHIFVHPGSHNMYEDSFPYWVEYIIIIIIKMHNPRNVLEKTVYSRD